MPLVVGPRNYPYVGADLEPLPAEEFRTSAATVREALHAYAQHYGVTISPHEWQPGERFPAGCYFDYEDKSHPRWPHVLIDVHVRRATADLCVKQDLDFPLESADVVHLGIPAC